MQSVYENQNARFSDPEWCFLAKYSLREQMIDKDLHDELTGTLLFRFIKGLGLPQDQIDNIERTLKGFIDQTQMHINQGSCEFPVYIRLFCQKMAVEKITSVESMSQFKADQTIGLIQKIRHFDAEKNGGWGFFMVERSWDSQTGSSVSTHNSVDVYLYKEGE